jgi:hypothetical protein
MCPPAFPDWVVSAGRGASTATLRGWSPRAATTKTYLQGAAGKSAYYALQSRFLDSVVLHGFRAL